MTEAIREGDIPGVQLRCRQPLPLPPVEAWAWLVQGAKLDLWLADEASVEAGPQGSLALLGTGSGTEVEAGWRERGRTLAWAPPGLWVLAFERLDAGWTAPTRLTLALHPRSGGAELDVLQHGFQRLPLSLCLTAWEAYRRRWRAALARLAEAVAPAPE
jgi:activator of Hsp90 ATPase-like protein